MPFETILQNSLVGGQISPRLRGRVDIERYAQGAARLSNFVVQPHGGAQRRSGSRFITEVKDSAGFTRLIPFELAAAQSYVLEVGAGYIRFLLGHGQVIDGRNFANPDFVAGIDDWTDISAGTGAIAHDAGLEVLNLVGGGAGNEARAEQILPAVSTQGYIVTVDVAGGAVTYKVGTTSGASDIATGSLAAGVDRTFAFATAISRDAYVTFENANADTRSIDALRLSDPVYELDAPYSAADADELTFVQTSLALYLVHPDWAPRRLRREAVNQWRLEVLDFLDGPYLDFDVDEQPTVTLNPAAASGSGIAVVASAAGDINDGQGFLAGDVGRLLRLDNHASAVDWGWAVIVTVTDPLNITVDIRRAFAAATATTRWRLGAWSGTTGYPKAASFWESRLFFGGSQAEPDRVWSSKSGTDQSEIFAPSDADGTVSDDAALVWQIADDSTQAVEWLAAASELVIGTVSAEITLSSGSAALALTPTAIRAARRTTRGSAAFVRPLKIDNQLLHVQRAGRKLREFRFDLDIEGYVSEDLTIVAEDITRSGVLDLAFQQEPDAVVWAITRDGRLVGLTYEKEQEVLAWHEHQIGGAFAGGAAIVESMAATKTPDQTADELTVVVLRTVDGATRRYIEYFEQRYDAETDAQALALFVDAGLSYDGAPLSAFGGMAHLEGETIQVLADGAVRPDVTVTGGGFTLTSPASRVNAGLGYVSEIVTLPPEGGSRDGPALTRQRRIDTVRVLFHDTLGGLIGSSADDLEEIVVRDAGDLMDAPPPVQSGVFDQPFPGQDEDEPQIVIRQQQPLPMTVLAISFGLDTGA